jgi:BirA family transcriptional regulator, biotin operon repressor / biotin---[acetyl-CoA-carboxylase] ligase
VLSEDALRRALRTAGLNAPVRWDDETGSTNATAAAMASDGSPAWTLVAAGHQTAGRGRHGRAWVDRPGSALLCSLVLRPAMDPAAVGLVSLAAGAAMAEAASELSDRAVRCTWPNDLLVEGAKVGGILGETAIRAGRLDHVVVGVGVNLDPPDGVPGAGAIGPVDEEALLSGFLQRFRSLVEGPSEEIVSRWRSISDTLGRPVRATTVGGDMVRGVAADLDETGALLIDTDGGRVTVASGEVRRLDVDPG